jgi:glycolate oxidase FAD binding subunit
MAQPATALETARILATSASVRPFGGRTKLDWGSAAPPPEVELSTAGLNRIVAHNRGDLTAVLEAGVHLADAQAEFARAGQRLSVDPPDDRLEATVGGVAAAADSGPLRHRHGAIRDVILGVRVALPDGSVARAGSNVIKNVAGYDLAKLMCGALGTLGVITEITVRLHSLPQRTVTMIARGHDLGRLTAAARVIAQRPLQLESLDLRWDGADAGGCVLARAGGRAAGEVAAAAAVMAHAASLDVALVDDDDELWREQRARQRAPVGMAVLRVSALPTALERVLGAVPSGIARAALGLSWLRIPADAAEVRRVRDALAPAACVVLEAPRALRETVDVWDVSGPAVELARRVKDRFDPRRTCNPGRHVGGI